jgi:hypothetical protein
MHDVTDVTVNIASSTAKAPAMIEAAPVTAAATSAATERVHSRQVQRAAAAAAVQPQRKQKRGSPSKRFKAWLRKLLK